MAIMEQRVMVDTALASAAISTPLWVQQLETWVGLFALVAGAILLALRIGLAVRECRSKK